MSNDRLKYLLERYIKDASTPEETKELFKWVRNLSNDSLLKQRVKELWLDREGTQQPETDWGIIYSRILNAPVSTEKRVWLRVAAAIVVILGLCTFFLLSGHNDQIAVMDEGQLIKEELIPGGDKAILTLANGEQIVLENSEDGTLTEQGNTKIIKLDQGQLSYQGLDSESGVLMYNTISTPRGGQYQIVLSDGSKVWLNASSSLRFPVAFANSNRDVTLIGEGYFEIIEKKTSPFVVKVNGIEIHVLGTHFNINGYTDEGSTKTTLLEGAVKVYDGRTNKVIHPGEQAEFRKNSILIHEVDVDAVIAWKNGRFIFKGEDIHSVMRQLSRWYDADVSFEENVTREQFVGVINRSRYDSIVEILEMLEKTGTVSFSIQGNNIKVKPYLNDNSQL